MRASYTVRWGNDAVSPLSFLRLTRIGAQLLALVFLVPSPSAAQATVNEVLRAVSVGPGAAEVTRADSAYSIHFVRKPRLRRVRNASGVGLAESLRVEAEVGVVGDRGLPGRQLGMTLSARSDAGAFVTGGAVTGPDGIARPAIAFSVPPGSLGVTVQACLTGDASACSEPIRLSTRDWVSFDLGFDFTLSSAFTFDNVKNADVSFATAISPRLQVHLWESEHRWKYSRLSAYGTIPLLYRNRGVVPFELSSPNYTFGQAAGLADFATGLSLNLRGTLLVDVSYNGRSGKLNLVESTRTVAQPGLINLGDGFESVDATTQVNAFMGQRTFLFGVGSLSVATPRRLSGDRVTMRGDAYQVAAGFGAVRSGQNAILVWAGRERHEAIEMRTGNRTTTLIPTQDRWLVGVTGFGFARRRVNGSTGLLVAWADKQHVQLGFSGRVNVGLF